MEVETNEIKREELVEKSNVLRDFGIKEPILIEILSKLRENGINLELEDFTINELIEKLKGKIKDEGCN